MKKLLSVITVSLLCLSMFSILTPNVKAEVVWTKYNGNPLNLGDYVGSLWVILDGSTYKMWYASGGDIYYATSSDGISWNAYGKVLQKTADSWEASLGRPSVILDGAMYKMWYHGYNPAEEFARIGYATSSDGISWTKYGGNPVLTPGGNGGWDNWNVGSPSVLKDGSTYRMWYTAQDYQYSPQRIGYATSSDGISWTKYGNNPVLTPGGNGGWDDKHVYEHFVMKEGTTFKMYYMGQSQSDIAQIGLATSTDGASWTKYANNPVLPVGGTGAWDAHSESMGSVVFDGSTYKMWYQGMNVVNGVWKIGLAATNWPPVAGFSWSPVTQGEGSPVQFIDQSADSNGYIASWSWDFSGLGTSTDQNPSFTFMDGGQYTVTLTVIDNYGATNTVSHEITINNVAPEITSLTSGAISENDVATVSGTFSDPSTLDTFTVTIDWGEGSPTVLYLSAGSVSFSATHQYLDDTPTGTTSDACAVSVTIADDDSGNDIETTTVTINNVAPTIVSAVYPVDPVKVNTPVTFSAIFVDPGTLDTHTACWYWDDGTNTEVSVTSGGRTVTSSRTFISAGIYEVTLRITDDDTGYDEAIYTGYIVVYDSDGGFVTGGGWINSPAGAYTADPTLTGKATFGFVSKYHKGATVPTGNTEFRFHGAGLNFKSTNYDWLVVAGTRAQYKGTGTINAAGNYGFMLTAVDGDSKSRDMFRIKIWDKATDEIVYDNQIGASDTADPTTAIEGGSIVIHK